MSRVRVVQRIWSLKPSANRERKGGSAGWFAAGGASKDLRYWRRWPAMCEGCFAPAVGEVAEVWRVGVFKEGEVVFPSGSVVVAFHAVGAGALGVVHG